MKSIAAIFATAMVFCVTSVQAQDAALRTQAEFVFGGVKLSIQTGFDDAPLYAARFAGLAPDCNPDCIAPYSAGDGVTTVMEPGVFEFLADAVSRNTGLLVDARLPNDRALGFIPGSVNLPAQTASPENKFRDEILEALGARAFGGVYNFADAQSLVIFDSGPTQSDAGVLIRHLLEAGYPTEKLRYYRGGMQVWSVLGLTIQE